MTCIGSLVHPMLHDENCASVSGANGLSVAMIRNLSAVRKIKITERNAKIRINIYITQKSLTGLITSLKTVLEFCIINFTTA